MGATAKDGWELSRAEKGVAGRDQVWLYSAQHAPLQSGVGVAIMRPRGNGKWGHGGDGRGELVLGPGETWERGGAGREEGHDLATSRS